MQNYEVSENQAGLSKEISKLEGVFARELTPQLAHDYVSSLVEALGGIDQPFSEFVAKGKDLHFVIGNEVYGHLIVGFCQWLKKHTEALNHKGKIFFALRDAAPLEVAAKVLWKNNGLSTVGLYANRPLLGVEDEIAPEKSLENGKVKSYFENKGLQTNAKVVWVDTGAWGTVIKALKQTFLSDKEFYPLFWYSHNPHIPGYINELLGIAGFPDKFGEVINDSLECMFPQKWLRPLQITEDSDEVLLLPSNYLSVVWGTSAIAGVEAAAKSYFNKTISPGEQVRELLKLEKLSNEAQATGNWTGVLPTNTPTWSQGLEFLADWPSNLLP